MNTSLVMVGVIAFLSLVVLYLLFRCRHDWEPVVERELPSKAEELKKNGENIATWRSPSQLIQIATKTVVAIISCKKCGAVKIFKVTT